MKKRVLWVGALALLISAKIFYRQAPADEPAWLLVPTAHLSSLLTGLSFEPLNSQGFTDPDRLYIINRDCSGINFFLLLSLAVFLNNMRKRGSGSVYRLLLLLAAAYPVTIGANAIRIALSIRISLLEGVFPILALYPEMVHLTVGTLVYFTVLILFYLTIRGGRDFLRSFLPGAEEPRCPTNQTLEKCK